MLLRKAFSISRAETVFTSVASEEQGVLATLSPFGYIGIVPDTMYDRTQQLKLFGSVSPQEWQERKAINVNGPYYKWRTMNGKLFTTPAMPAGHTVAYEYFSSFFVLDGDVPATRKQYPTKDTDTFVFNDALPIAFLTQHYLRRKGLEYAEDFRKYESLVTELASKQTNAQSVALDKKLMPGQPGIFVPVGSWPL